MRIRARLKAAARMRRAWYTGRNLYIGGCSFVLRTVSASRIFYACRGDFKSACSSQASTAGNVQAIDHRLVDALSITASGGG